MSDNRTDLPSPSAPNFQQRLRETVQTYLGRQGNPLDRGLTVRDLIENGIVSLKNGFSLRPGQSGTLPLMPGSAVIDAYKPDLTPPPVPTGLVATAAISHVFIEHDAPLYRQGHGHLRTRLYGKIVSAGDPLPTFSDAVEIARFGGTVYAHPSNPATTWRIWIKWETVDGVLSPSPAGGTNGVEVTTGQDVALLLEALTGEITESQLYKDLGERIDLIDGDAPGSVNARVLNEANARAQALLDEAAARGAAITIEATARADADTSLATQITTLTAAVTTGDSQLAAAIQSEATARAGGDSAEASARETLAARVTTAEGTLTAQAIQITDRYTKADTDSAISSASAALTAAYQAADSSVLGSANAHSDAAITAEQTARADADSALSSQLTTLAAAVTAGDSALESAIQSEQTARASTIQAEAAARQTLQSTVETNNTTLSAAIQTEATTRATQTGDLFAQYTVKVDVNGYVSGFGLASTANNGTPSSSFAVRADQFYIANPSGPGIAPSMPFIVQTTPTMINGVEVPIGVYMRDAFIQNGTITNAKIANLAVDDAKIASLSVDKLTAGSVAVGQHIQSTGYVSGSAGWRIHGDGNAEFSNVTVRGTVYAKNGQFAGTLLGGAADGYSSGIGFYAGSPAAGAYQWRVGNPAGNRLEWDGANINLVSPQLTVASGNASFSGTLDAATMNSGRINLQHNGSWDWGYARSLDKWWGDGQNGWVLARHANGSTLMEMRGGSNRIWMSSWDDCGIQFPGITIANEGLTISQANVINTLQLAGNSATVSNATSGLGELISTTILLKANTALKVVLIVNFGNFTSFGSYSGAFYAWYSLNIDGNTNNQSASRDSWNGDENYFDARTYMHSVTLDGGSYDRTVTVSAAASVLGSAVEVSKVIAVFGMMR